MEKFLLTRGSKNMTEQQFIYEYADDRIPVLEEDNEDEQILLLEFDVDFDILENALEQKDKDK